MPVAPQSIHTWVDNCWLFLVNSHGITESFASNDSCNTSILHTDRYEIAHHHTAFYQKSLCQLQSCLSLSSLIFCWFLRTTTGFNFHILPSSWEHYLKLPDCDIFCLAGVIPVKVQTLSICNNFWSLVCLNRLVVNTEINRRQPRLSC